MARSAKWHAKMASKERGSVEEQLEALWAFVDSVSPDKEALDPQVKEVLNRGRVKDV